MQLWDQREPRRCYQLTFLTVQWSFNERYDKGFHIEENYITDNIARNGKIIMSDNHLHLLSGRNDYTLLRAISLRMRNQYVWEVWMSCESFISPRVRPWKHFNCVWCPIRERGGGRLEFFFKLNVIITQCFNIHWCNRRTIQGSLLAPDGDIRGYIYS